jgi:hypothetical protein
MKENIMQRIVAMTAIMLLVIAPMAGAPNVPSVNKVGVGVNGGLMLPVSGDCDPSYFGRHNL